MIKEVYLDNSATTKPRQEVVQTMLTVLTDKYGNPSSLHAKGLEVEKMVKESRARIAALLKCKPEEVIFSSGGTEANNLAVRGAVLANKNRGSHIIVSKFEHPSVLNTYKALEKEGYKVTYLDINKEGFVNLEHLSQSIGHDTILVSIMHVNSEVGTIQPVEEAGRIIKEKNKNTKFHIDAVQSFSKLEINPDKFAADLITVSSHKIHGPKGAGALFVRKGTKVSSLLYGGSQELSIRPGTENIPGIIGFGEAAKIEKGSHKEEIDRIQRLREDLENKILSNIPDTILNGSKENRAPHIANISFLGVRGEVLLHSLEAKGIFVSTGSACSSHSHEPSHVLSSMGVDKEAMEGAVRFSLGAFNSQEDIDYCVENLVPMVAQLRKFKRR